MRGRFRGNRSTRTHRKQSRTPQVWGSLGRGAGEDNGKWYRCWVCGFLCNKDRDSLGDSESRSGVVHEDYNPTENVVMRNMGVGSTGDETRTHVYEPDSSIYGSVAITGQTAVLGGDINSFQVAAEQDSAGDNREVRHPIRVSDKSYGCPFCHSQNWRGDFP